MSICFYKQNTLIKKKNRNANVNTKCFQYGKNPLRNLHFNGTTLQNVVINATNI